jgi:hypothetical protein
LEDTKLKLTVEYTGMEFSFVKTSRITLYTLMMQQRTLDLLEEVIETTKITKRSKQMVIILKIIVITMVITTIMNQKTK